MKFKPAISGKPVSYLLSFVYSQVVHNYVNHFVFRAVAIQLLKKIEEFNPSMTLLHLSDNPATMDHECRKEADSSVALIFKLPFSGTARSFWFIRVFTAESLNSGFFVNAYNQRIFWWGQIETANLCRFGLEIRILAVQPRLHLMWVKV